MKLPKSIHPNVLQLRVNEKVIVLNGREFEQEKKLPYSWFWEYGGQYFGFMFLLLLPYRVLKSMIADFDTFLSKTEWYESSRVRHQRDINFK